MALSVARLIALAEVLDAPVGELLSGLSTRAEMRPALKAADWLSA